MAAVDYQIFLTKNDCCKAGQKMTPKGIVVHSTGCNNPYLSRYIAPDNGKIGKNLYANDWNRSGLDVCVHAFIGKDQNGAVKTVQTLPFDICCWGVGGGRNGSYNYNPAYIQFEMCEDGLKDGAYCKAVYNKAVEFCTYICKKYNIPVKNIVSHYEAHQLGYGSDHIDPTNWWKYHSLTMDMFRADVTKAIGGKQAESFTMTFYNVGKECDAPAGQVKTIQRLLNWLKYYGKDGKTLAVDGVCGDNTEYAIKVYQGKHNLSTTGVVDKKTWKTLTAGK